MTKPKENALTRAECGALASHATRRTPEVELALLEHVANGGTVRQFCLAQDPPLSRSAVYAWLREDPDLAVQLAHARDIGCQQIEDEILEIADNASDHEDDVQHRKLQIYAREKLLTWHNPGRYGQKAQVDMTTRQAPPEMTELERATRVRQLLEKAGVRVVEVEVHDAEQQGGADAES